MASKNITWGDPLAITREISAINYAAFAWPLQGTAFYSELPGIGKPLGGQSYKHYKRFSQLGVDVTPIAMLPYLNQVLLSPVAQDYLRGDDMASLFEFVGNEIEKFKEACKHKGIPMADAELYGEKYNHQFLVENEKGEIVPISEQQLLSLFPQPDELSGKQAEQMPRIVFTSSHARGETLEDVTDITHGIERVISEATQGGASFARVDMAQSQLGVKPGQTLIVYRCDVDKNPWLNGAALLRRINEIERSLEDGTPDKFEEVSPGAIAISHMTLALMARHPEQILAAQGALLDEHYAADSPHIKLRHDAPRIANHLAMMGYSKGGNVVSDAGCRLLPHELQAKDGNGRELFYSAQNGEFRAISAEGIHEVRRLISPIPVWALGAVEHELTDEQLAAGASRVAFNGYHDYISIHGNYGDRPGDERVIGDVPLKELGHGPKDNLGTPDSPGSMMQSPRIRRRMEEVCAPMIGKATIEHWVPDYEDRRVIVLKTAPGTTDRLMMKMHKQAIEEAFAKQGLPAQLEAPFRHSGEFWLRLDHPLTKADTPLIQKAFQYLRDERQGLLISDAISSPATSPQL